MSRGPDVGTLLGRALRASAAAAGCPVTIDATQWDRWVSATFAGARHRLSLGGAATPDLIRWMAGLGEAELPLPGHLVADLKLAGVSSLGDRLRADLEVLTVESR